MVVLRGIRLNSFSPREGESGARLCPCLVSGSIVWIVDSYSCWNRVLKHPNSSNETDLTDHAAVRFPPPLIPVATIIVGYLLGRFVPILEFVQLPTPERFWLGGVIVVAAILVLGVWPIRLFKKTGQDVKPWTDTPEIVVEGPYRFTRNPMYLMMIVVCIGFAILLSEAWILILTPMCAWLIFMIAIRHEEAYLARKFGASYHKYKNRVRRWI